jgi:hypothetical protein
MCDRPLRGDEFTAVGVADGSIAADHSPSLSVRTRSLCAEPSYEKFEAHEPVDHLVRQAFDALQPFS